MTTTRHSTHVGFFVCSLALLVACSGGDGDSDPTNPTPTGGGGSGGQGAAGGSGGGDPSTGGEGGEPGPPPGVSCDESFQHAGYEGCLSEVDGLQVKFFEPAGDTPVERLVIYFHGDTGNGWFENWGFADSILDFAIPQNFLVLGAMAPSSYDGDDLPAYGAAQPEHADQVATLIETFLERYEVVQERSLYWGVSGGSWFFTSSFIPAAGHRVPGVFVANCGGSGFSFGWAWDPATDAATVALNSLYVNYGDQDFLAPGAADSVAEYAALGFVTGELVHPGATHCAHPIPEPTIDFWMGEL
jgi:hypothetical protein